MGFCLLANVAIAAQYLRDHHGSERVAIVDWDVHHGNGTQHLFEERDDVLSISLHGHPAYVYPGTGFAEERGRDAGDGATLNVPFYPGAVKRRLSPCVRRAGAAVTRRLQAAVRAGVRRVRRTRARSARSA